MTSSEKENWVALVILLLGSWTLAMAEVTYDGRSLIIDGQRKILFSGSIHYPRSTPQVIVIMPLISSSSTAFHSIPLICNSFIFYIMYVCARVGIVMKPTFSKTPQFTKKFWVWKKFIIKDGRKKERDSLFESSINILTKIID